jgi:predicted nuclease of predicted toxin-antitoxin system
VDSAVVQRLRLDGHEVAYVAEMAPSMPDEEILREANATGALLLTADKDFGELVFRRRLLHAGVILLRLAGLTNPTKADVVAEVCEEHEADLTGSFSVVSPGQVRIRPGP